MFSKFTTTATLFSALALSIYAQGLDTRASKNDWEEINFEFNSAVLSDGYPSLLRLADLLKANPTYRVRVEGHADGIGSNRYNEKLGLARANMVRDFLVKYGAAAGQIDTTSKGKLDPEVPGEKRRYSKTDVARWMNRRVVLTVMDAQGRTVGAGGAGEAINAIAQAPAAATQACCDEILKRLDKLDDIARMLRELSDQNAGLRREVDSLKQQQAALESKVNGLPKPLNESQTAQVVNNEITRLRDPRFSLLGLNVGADNFRHVTFTGKGRFFAPFKEHFAVQAQGEYYYWRDSREGQFDIGLVNRIGNFQAGLFSSFKHVTLRGDQSGGTLGQGALTADYLFRLGRVGVFGTKGFLDNALLNRTNAVLDGPNGSFIAPNLFLERYLHLVDQVGVSTTLGLWKDNYLEANFGYLKSRGNADRPGGTIRFIFPVGNRLAFTVEGGMNETLLERDNTGRAVVGVQFGNFTKPREFTTVTHPVPVDVPRVRYEVLTRRVRVGSAPPVADAGPDQIGVPAGTITLNGSNSYDPNGERLTYSWVQEGGPNVAISGANTAIATFTAAAGQSYVFRLTVRNESGLMASARVHVTTRAEDRVQILFFTANPTTIRQGQASQLAWRVLNASSVDITEIGRVAASGNSSVSPRQTTTYKLTARNAISEENATVTVTVEIPQTQISGCFATPTNIMPGEAATINFQTQNATRVTAMPDVGPLAMSGNFVVTPTQTTTYVINAEGPNNQRASCSVVVTVNAVTQVPRIVRFTAAPTAIVAGQKSTLVWQVEGADKGNISPTVGDVSLVGTSDVTPAQTTTYTLTATNKAGTATATATVTVTPGVTITTFTANPPVSPSPGANVTLTCLATNATTVTIAGAGPLGTDGTVVVTPKVDTTYTCTATGSAGTDTKSLTVKVTQPQPPPATGPPPTVVITGGPVIETVVRQLRIDASQSSSPAGNTPLKYFWTSRETRAAIDDATSPSPTVYLGNLAGSYFFDLTVTDSKGNVSTGTVEVRLVVTRVP
jgi:hypothetical protein